jgi:hypothetical protein
MFKIIIIGIETIRPSVKTIQYRHGHRQGQIGDK